MQIKMIKVPLILAVIAVARSETDYCSYEKSRNAALRFVNSRILREIEVLKRRNAELENTISNLTESTTSSSAITTSSIIHEGAVTDSCKTKCTGGCFWVEVTPYDGKTSESYYTYAEAENLCEDYDSVVAVIPDEETYNAVVENARPKGDAGGWGRFNIWIAMRTTNPTTGEVYPRDAFYKWFPGEPDSKPDETNILIHVRNDPDDKSQGMHNRPPTQSFSGVVCWKPRRSL